jgi:hypothetical protein
MELTRIKNKDINSQYVFKKQIKQLFLMKTLSYFL